MANKCEVVISFDTTGSMSSCLAEVKKNVKEIIGRLLKDYPGVFRIGLIAHGDYCDEKTTYVMKWVDLTDDGDKLINFINTTGGTGGGDYAECYEKILKDSQFIMSWSPSALKSLVMIGDAYPHEKHENPQKIDWREEVVEINKMGINIYSVQALHSGGGPSYTFYKQMAQMTNGYHLFLDQFSYVRDMLLAIFCKQIGEDELAKYEQEVTLRKNGMNLSMRKMFDTMLGRAPVAVEDAKYDPNDDKLSACPPSKYQILNVDEALPIKDFITKNGLAFKKGKGFYEFTKTETIAANKEVVLMKKDTAELFEGKYARKLIGLSDVDKRYKPTDIPEYKVFIQSSSYNRKLVADTGFLYEAADFGLH